MGSDWDDLISAEEILGGLPARRATSLLLAIEGRTGLLAARARTAMAPDYSGRTSEHAEQAYLSALASGANLPEDPTVHDLERYAKQWASLAPEDPSTRAALIKLIGDKYRMPSNRTLRIQEALGAGEAEVQKRFEELYHRPLSSIYVPNQSFRERLDWLQFRFTSRFENLPPFWTAYALTLTETVGAGVLALPIAFAQLGVLGAIILLLIMAAVNIMTIAAMSEAIARNGNVRYDNAYFGRLVTDYLGRFGGLLLVPMIYLLTIVSLIAYAIGFSSTLSNAVGLSPTVWVFLMLLIILYFVRGESIGATVASAIIVGACTITLIVLLSLLSFPHLNKEYVRHSNIPFTSGNEFDASMLQLIFGVVLASFFGHTTIANCAKVVLERDPSAKSLFRGATLAIATAAGLYTLWIVAVNGSVAPEVLADQRGTALAPLADVVGNSVNVLGVIFVVLAMGMAAILQGWSLATLVREHFAATSGNGDASGWHEMLIRTGLAPMLPVIGLFALVEFLFVLDRESFSRPLSILGAIVIPIIGGVFGMMMLSAARKKGDCAVQAGWKFLGKPAVVIGISLLFAFAILIHGLIIWTDPFSRGLAIATAAIALSFIIVTWRRELIPRSVAEIRFEPDRSQDPEINLLAIGEPVLGMIEIRSSTKRLDVPSVASNRNALDETLHITFPATPVQRMKIWVHRMSGGDVSEPIISDVSIDGNSPIDLKKHDGQLILPVDGKETDIAIRFNRHDAMTESI